MFISRATCTSQDYGERQYAIYVDMGDGAEADLKNTNDVFYVSIERPIAKAILQAAACERIPIPFECNKVNYQMIRYSYNKFERIYNEHRKNHVSGYEKRIPTSEIYVYSQRCRCFSCYEEYGFDSIISICAGIPLADKRKVLVDIDLQKCTRCGKYFIDGQSLEQYEKQYGKLQIYRHMVYDYDLHVHCGDEVLYNSDSILSRNGYSTKLDKGTRRMILIRMMRNGINKAEIKDKLSEFISFRGKRFPNASVIWQDDLRFVNDYNLDRENRVEFY